MQAHDEPENVEDGSEALRALPEGIVKEIGALNIIVTCPKAFRAFEPATGRMYYEPELMQQGVGMTPTGKLVFVAGENAGRFATGLIPLWNTGQKDEVGNSLYEGDICEVDVDTGFGSFVERVGIMRWNVMHNCFSLHFNGRGTYSGGVRIGGSRKIGNEFQDKSAGERYQKDNG